MVKWHVLCLSLLIIWGILPGCVSTTSEWKSDEIPNVGYYSPAPSGAPQKTMAVLEFKDKTGGNRGAAAADQMTTLWLKTRRFRIVERTRLDDVLKEQNMGGIVAPEEQIPKQQMLGAELLCMGSITDFEIKTTKTGQRSGILNVLPIRVLDIDFKKQVLDFHIGVDVRIVDSRTGETVFADTTDVKRSETASAMGLELVGISARSDGSIQIDNRNQGKLLRMALDQVVKKMLPDIDHTYSYYR